MFFEKYSFKVLLFVFVLEIVFPVFVNGTPLKQELSSKVSLDFSEADIRDVVRAVSSAYHIPIIVDQIVNAKVTVHLENVEVWDALHAICGANGLSFRRENGVFRIQKETTGNKDFFALRNGKIDLNVNGKELKDFLQEFSKNTGLSVVFPAEIKGNVYANIQGVSPKAALSTILSANKYSLLERDSLFFVSQGAIISKENELEILRTGNRFCLKADGVSIGTIVRELAKKASKNIVLYAEAEENIGKCAEEETNREHNACTVAVRDDTIHKARQTVDDTVQGQEETKLHLRDSELGSQTGHCHREVLANKVEQGIAYHRNNDGTNLPISK